MRTRHPHRACILALLLPLVAPDASLADGDLKPARKRLARAMVEWSLVPKVDIGTKGVFDLRPDGRPTDDRQGRLKLGVFSGAAGSRKSKACMQQGRHYRPGGTGIALDLDKRTFQVILYSCAWFKIHYGRPVTAADLEPSAVARALSGLFEITGPGVEGGLEAVLEKALLPIEVADHRARFQGIAFSTPAGWESELVERELHFRRARNQDIRIRSRELEPAEVRAGPAIMLQEELPRRLLESARKVDPRARVETLARAYEQAGFGMGWADVVYDGNYERHHWVFDEEAGRLYTLRAKGRPDDRTLFAAAMTGLMDSVGPAEAGFSAAVGSGGGPSGPDLPTPTDFGRPGLGEEPSVIDLQAAAIPGRVRPGETLELKMTFEIDGSEGAKIEVTERRTLRYHGEVLPNYPIVEKSLLAPGRYETVLPETIPDLADAGSYELHSELCVGDQCRSRTSTFEVVR